MTSRTAAVAAEGVKDFNVAPSLRESPGTETEADVRKAALISDCGLYRYWLTREWGGGYKLPFVMLNPSTADAELDDQTIRRCMGFARREGFSGIIVCNLFALRSTDPAVLKKARDPVGPENDRWVGELLDCAHVIPVMAAWGVHGALNERAARVMRRFSEHNAPLWCLGKTKDGHPKHPLYLPAGAPVTALVSARNGSALNPPSPTPFREEDRGR